MNYKSAGVDVEAGYRGVTLFKDYVKKSFNGNVLSGIGGFGGLFSIKFAKDMDDPVLVSGTDGVGSKLAIAFLMDKHDTVGIDCAAMCVNDIVCSGAKPLYFLDYIACGKNIPEKIADIVKGVTDGCIQAGCALIGGETAEHPGLMPPDEYDLAGFAAGIAERRGIIDGSSVKEGDAVIGIASNGLHSNGFSLVRQILKPDETNISEFILPLGVTLGEELLRPTRIYVKPVLELIRQTKVSGIANITGGGFYENIPRMFPKGLTAKISKGSWRIPPIFGYLQETGGVSEKDMYGTFNMGIGMTVTVPGNLAGEAVRILKENGEDACVIGSAVRGDGIIIC